jgi:hypothetical protein
VQRKAAEPSRAKDKPPHPATAQRKAAEPARKEAKPPHPATLKRGAAAQAENAGGGAAGPKRGNKGGGGCRGFKDQKARYQPYKKRGRGGAVEEGPAFDSMGFASVEEYEKAGIDFMNAPEAFAVDVTNGRGERMRYDAGRNWLGVMDKQGYLRAFYSPGVAFASDLQRVVDFMRAR